ncbi:MAG TPA: DUF1570 domain-containing protein [Anaeromyxobacteraceae bacterium]|nr:DUF1570 domain-containing protein [Anaeromyxobacteraceae bacterium]
MTPRAAALALSLSLAGCATAGGPFVCPAHGGPPWRDVASPHFLLRTDLGDDAAAALLARLERLRAAVLSALFDDAPAAEGGVEVVAFRSDAEYRPFAPPGVAAYYLRSAGGPPRIVLSGELLTDQRAMLAHELTHHLVAAVFQRQPRWLAEGLATQMESLADQGEGAEVAVGAPPPARLARVRQSGHQVPVRELLAWDGTGGIERALDAYATSWLLTHFLAYRHPAPFADLQRRLAGGEPPDAAWAAAFPAWAPAAPNGLEGLDASLATYAQAEVQTRFREVRSAWRGAPSVRPIPPAEVHAIRLSLWAIGPDKGAAALRAEVAETLAEDPGHPLALQQLAALDRTDPLPLARAAVAAHLADARAWTFLATALRGPGAAAEREAAYRRAAELAEGNAAALHNLAVELLDQGRSGEALPVARRAASLAPWSPPVLDGFAAVLADLGRCREAIPVEQRAIDVLPERGGDAARAALAARLARWEAQCRPRP